MPEREPVETPMWPEKDVEELAEKLVGIPADQWQMKEWRSDTFVFATERGGNTIEIERADVNRDCSHWPEKAKWNLFRGEEPRIIHLSVYVKVNGNTVAKWLDLRDKYSMSKLSRTMRRVGSTLNDFAGQLYQPYAEYQERYWAEQRAREEQIKSEAEAEATQERRRTLGSF